MFLFTAGIVLAMAFTLSCEEKNADKPSPAVADTAKAEAVVPKTAAPAVPDKRETFTDSRDGKKYKAVKIGKQTWMAENLNFDAKGSKCYDNKPANCEKYGRLYDWETAKKACPKGWHLPTEDEWVELLLEFIASSKEDVMQLHEDDREYYSNAGKYLKAKSGWDENGNGTDEFGFSALPGGYGGSDGSFSDVGDYGCWWSVIEINSGDAYCRSMDVNNNEVAAWYDHNKSRLHSARCIKDK